MAYSRVTKIGDGVSTQFPVNFALGYISQGHITARVGTESDGLGQPIYRAITYLSENLLQIAGAPAGIGVPILFERTVPKDALLVNYSNGDVLDEENLDISQKQSAMLVQEVIDGRFATLTQNLDVGGFRVVNMAGPVANTDAATKQYVDVTFSPFVTVVNEIETITDDLEQLAADAASSENNANASAVAAAASAAAAATFNPALYALRSGTTFTGGINGTTGLFSGVVSGAAATADGHLLNRTTADARYDRITTSPTALTNGATIPSTENGRSYSLALPTVQTATLPASAGLPDGFSVIVRATGLPAGYQTSSIAGGGKNILYRNNAAANFFLIGNGEVFRFTWLSGLDVWIAECLVQPGTAGTRATTSSNLAAWNTSPTAWTPVPAYRNQQAIPTLYQINANHFQVAAAGVYHVSGYVNFSAGAGGGVTGDGYIIGGGGSPDSGWGAYNYQRCNVGTGDGCIVDVSWTEALAPAATRTPYFLASQAALWTILNGNLATIVLVGR